MASFRGLFKQKSILLLVILNFVLAISAFIKDIAMAKYFGTTNIADAFTLGFFIPDTIGNNLLATGLGVTCIPIFSRLLVQKRFSLLKHVFWQIFMFVALGAIVLTICLWSFAKPVLLITGKGFGAETLAMMQQDYMVMVPLVVIFPLLAIISSFMQSGRQFVIPALNPILFNLIWFMVLLVCLVNNVNVTHAGFILSLCLTCGGVICLLYFLPFLKQLSLLSKVETKGIRKWKISPYVFEALRQFLPYIIILLFSQSLLVVERALASHLSEGSVAALNYTYRLVQFPIWIVVAAISTVLLPSFSKDLSLKNHPNVRRQMKQALVFVIFLSLMASLVLYLFRYPIVSLLFKHGAFNTTSVNMTASLLSGYSWAILGQAIAFISLRYFSAKRKLAMPLLITLIGFIISCCFDFLMVEKLGLSALGYGASIGACVSAAAYIIIFYKEWGVGLWLHWKKQNRHI